MLFNSWHFVVFYILVTTIFFTLRHKWRIYFLLAASSYFYMMFAPIYILIILGINIFDFKASQYIEREQGPRRKLLLVFSLIINISVLSFFKYFNFLSETTQVLGRLVGFNWNLPLSHLLLPIGLSFHTFQSMGYVIDVYRGNQKAERNFFKYNLFVLFYPQLVAGPIERAKNLLNQFDVEQNPKIENFVAGFKLMAIGFYKKIVIADTLSVFVDLAYKSPNQYYGLQWIWISCLFAIQIYCDFSGYSDIARGVAKTMGFNLVINFKRPFDSQSIKELWQNWHITLNTWFRDYLYKPILNLMPHYSHKKNIGIFIVFAVSGLWHGASWKYVLWGILHALSIISLDLTYSIRTRLKINANIYINRAATLLTFAIIGILFRASTFEQSVFVFKQILNSYEKFCEFKFVYGSITEIAIPVLLFISLKLLEQFEISKSMYGVSTNSKNSVRWIYNYLFWLFLAIIAVVSFMLIGQSNQPFIYFQF